MERLFIKVRTSDALSFQIFSQAVSELVRLGKPEERESKVVPETTIIAPGSTVVGEVNAEGDVELSGSVKGKIVSQGNILVNGKILGDLSGKDIELKACVVQGNIIASGFVAVDGDSVVIDDIKSESFTLAIVILIKPRITPARIHEKK